METITSESFIFLASPFTDPPSFSTPTQEDYPSIYQNLRTYWEDTEKKIQCLIMEISSQTALATTLLHVSNSLNPSSDLSISISEVENYKLDKDRLTQFYSGLELQQPVIKKVCEIFINTKDSFTTLSKTISHSRLSNFIKDLERCHTIAVSYIHALETFQEKNKEAVFSLAISLRENNGGPLTTKQTQTVKKYTLTDLKKDDEAHRISLMSAALDDLSEDEETSSPKNPDSTTHKPSQTSSHPAPAISTTTAPQIPQTRHLAPQRPSRCSNGKGQNYTITRSVTPCYWTFDPQSNQCVLMFGHPS